MAKSKTHSAKAVARHHSDSPHTREIDIDLNRTYPNLELQALLTILKPLLRRAIEIARTCPPAEQGGFVAGYHNITVCDGERH